MHIMHDVYAMYWNEDRARSVRVSKAHEVEFRAREMGLLLRAEVFWVQALRL
jgi:hypothetical protein